MNLEIYFENLSIASVSSESHLAEYTHLKRLVSSITNVPECDLYATQNGRPVESRPSGECPVRFVSRMCGGKGGFGSMLRAIGAQIEKTTNREACRDLSGRRLRDIREEQSLREWAASKPKRLEEARKRKEDRLKRLCAVPSHEFQDPAYEEARRRLEEEGDAALEAGVLANPVKVAVGASNPKKRKPNLWIDEDLSDMSSSESGCEDDASPASSEELEPPRSSSKGKGLGKRSHAPGHNPTNPSVTQLKSSSKVDDSGNESDFKTV